MKKNEALLLVDIQYDFLPGGALAVKDGDAILTPIMAIIPQFENIIATQDWHPGNHGSFAANHSGKKPGEIINLGGLDQILWPIHCVQNSEGARFHQSLPIDRLNKIFQKGTDPEIDSYSGFYDNGRKKSTGLASYLKSANIDTLYIAGLAADYCVKYTALDAISEGFQTYVFHDCTRAVNLQKDDFEKAINEMKSKGVNIIHSKDLK